MKNLASFLTCAAALAAGAVLADLVPYDDVTKKESASFSLTADGTTVTTNGVTVTSTKVLTATGGYMSVEGELNAETAALSVKQKVTAVKEIETFTFEFKAAYADWNALPTPEAAAMGFAFTNGTTAVYYNGSSWKAFNTIAGVDEDAACTLVIDYDGRDTTKKARFKLGGSYLTVGTGDDVTRWVTVGTVAQNELAVYGTASIKSLAGYTIAEDSPVIVIHPEGKNVTFTEAQVATMKEQLGSSATLADVQMALSSSAKQANGLTALDNFILFGKVTGATAADKPVVKGAATATAPGSTTFAITMGGIDVKAVTGAKVAFELQGRVGDEEWTKVDSNATGNFAVPVNTTYRKFRVVTTVSYGAASNN